MTHKTHTSLSAKQPAEWRVVQATTASSVSRRTARLAKLAAVLMALGLTLAGCGLNDSVTPPTSSSSTSTTAVSPTSSEAIGGPNTSTGAPGDSTVTTSDATDSTARAVTEGEAFATVTDDSGEVIILERPERIVSLSATATEMLFAMGAGPQVVAVDSQSDFPAAAPTTDLSAFQPNVESIAAYQPDLVVLAYDPGDLTAGLKALDISVLRYEAPETLEGIRTQMDALGQATGNASAALAASNQVAEDITVAVAGIEPQTEPLTYYLELDPGLYSVASSTFIGQVFGLAGLKSIGDGAEGAAGGYPQLSAEYILEANPDFIFFTDCCGDTAASFGERPGWDGLDAVIGQRVIEFDADILSRWGPRIAQLVSDVAEVVNGYAAVLAG